MNTSYTDVINAAGPSQTVAYTGTAGTITNAIPAGAAGVMLFCTTAAYVKVGVSPTATTTDIPVPPNWMVIIPTPNNDGNYKVSAVQQATGGSMLVQPIAES